MAGVDWDALTPATAFVAGAVLATIAVLRVVRAVATMFAAEVRPRRRRRPDDDGNPGTPTSSDDPS